MNTFTNSSLSQELLCDLGVSGLPGVFLRWNRPSKFLEEAEKERIHIIKYNKELQAKVNALRRRLAELEAQQEEEEAQEEEEEEAQEEEVVVLQEEEEEVLQEEEEEEEEP